MLPLLQTGLNQVFRYSKIFALAIRQFDNDGSGTSRDRHYFHWNFEESTDPVPYSSSRDDLVNREAATTASGFGKIYIHSRKNSGKVNFP